MANPQPAPTVTTRTRRPRGDQGSASVFAAIIAAALVVVLALVVDGAAKLRGLAHADALAMEAARAGLSAVDTRGETVALDANAAVAAAQAYLTAAGATGQVDVLDTQTLQVTVTLHRDAPIGLFGPGWDLTGVATTALATADAQPGGP